MHIKTYIFTCFYPQYLVLFTMVPRNSVIICSNIIFFVCSFVFVVVAAAAVVVVVVVVVVSSCGSCLMRVFLCVFLRFV